MISTDKTHLSCKQNPVYFSISKFPTNWKSELKLYSTPANVHPKSQHKLQNNCKPLEEFQRTYK